MKKVTVKRNQTVYDIAVEQYGTCEAIPLIISDNPDLINDEQVKVNVGIDPSKDTDFYFDLPLKSGSTAMIDTDSRLLKKNIVREIETEITTFDLKDYGTNN